mgnify:CR=1 FL=1
MANLTIKLDTSDANDIVSYIASVTCEWDQHRREMLRDDVVACLGHAVQVSPERGGFVVVIGKPLFDVLDRYGIAPEVLP